MSDQGPNRPMAGTVAVVNLPNNPNDGTAVSNLLTSTLGSESKTSSCTKETKDQDPVPGTSAERSVELPPKIKHTCSHCHITFPYQTELTRHLIMVHKDKAGDLLQSFNNWVKEQNSQKERELLKVREAARAKINAAAEAKKRQQEMAIKAESEQRWKDMNIAKAKAAAEAFVAAREEQRQIRIAKLAEEAAKNQNLARIAAAKEKQQEIERTELAKQVAKKIEEEAKKKAIDEARLAREKQRQIQIAKLEEKAATENAIAAKKEKQRHLEIAKKQQKSWIFNSNYSQNRSKEREIDEALNCSSPPTPATISIVESVSKAELFKCRICGAIYHNISNFNSHMLDNHGEKLGTGPVVDVQESSVDHLPITIFIPIKKSHKARLVSPKKKRLTCKVCGAAFYNMANFKLHAKQCNHQDVGHPIKEAMNSVTPPIHLATPSKKSHKKCYGTSKKKKLTCKDCGAIFYNMENFKTHQIQLKHGDNLGSKYGISGGHIVPITSGSKRPCDPNRRICERCSVCHFEVEGTSWVDGWKKLENHVQQNHFTSVRNNGEVCQFVCKFCKNARSQVNLHGHISNCLSSLEIRNQVKKQRDRNGLGSVTTLQDPLEQFPSDLNFEEEVLLPQPMETFCEHEFQTVNCEICNMIFLNEADFRAHCDKEHNLNSSDPLSSSSVSANVDDGTEGYLQELDDIKSESESESEDESALGVIVPDPDAFVDDIDIDPETYVKAEEVDEKIFEVNPS